MLRPQAGVAVPGAGLADQEGARLLGRAGPDRLHRPALRSLPPQPPRLTRFRAPNRARLSARNLAGVWDYWYLATVGTGVDEAGGTRADLAGGGPVGPAGRSRARDRGGDRVVRPGTQGCHRLGDGVRLRRPHLRRRLRPHAGGRGHRRPGAGRHRLRGRRARLPRRERRAGPARGPAPQALGRRAGGGAAFGGRPVRQRHGDRDRGAAGRGTGVRRPRTGPAHRRRGEPVGARGRVHLQRPRGPLERGRMKAKGRSARYVFGVWGGIAVVSALAALVGYVALGGAPPELIAIITAVAAGAILTMIADTMIPEAFERTRTWTGVITTVGFLVAFAIDVAG